MTIEEQYEKSGKHHPRNTIPPRISIRSAPPMNSPRSTTASSARKSGEPYITHPLAVAQIVAEELHLDSESIEAALLHDCH